MAAAITFWQLPEEEDELIRFLEASGPILAVPKGKVQDKSQLKPRPLREVLKDGWENLLVSPADLLRELPIRHFDDPEGDSWAVLFTNVPALIYSRGKWRGPKKLGRSYISGSWTVLSDDESKILDQPPEFVKWGRKVLAWVRKYTPESHKYPTYRVTTRVAEAIKSGVEIVP